MRFFPVVLALFLIYFMGTVRELNAWTGDTTASFTRNDRVLSWQNGNEYVFNFGENLKLNLDNNLSSSLNFASGKGLKDRWYDSVINQAGLNWKASDRLFFDIVANEDWSRDSQSQVGNSILTTNLEGKAKYIQSNYLLLDGAIGYMNDQRFENEDKGTSVRGGFKLLDQSGKLKANLLFDGATSNLKRTNDLLNLKSEISFNNSLADIDLVLQQNGNTKGYFSEVDRSNVEERTRIERNLNLVFQRGNGVQNTGVELQMIVGERKLDDTANDEKSSSKYHNNSTGDVKNFGLSLQRGIGRFKGSMDAGYLRDSNDVELLIRSRTQTDVSFRSNIGLGVGKADTLSAQGWVKRTRIDTPESVPNDRDELKFDFGVNYIHYFSNIFETALDFRVLQTHYVNIDASQSSQNKWVDTYQISPSMIWEPFRAVRVNHIVSLYANVMDYDFDSNLNPRSNITRRVSSDTTVDAILSARLKTSFRLVLEDNEFANLDTEGFKLPSEEGIRRFGEIVLDYRFYDWLMVSPNYNYTIRRDNNVELERLIRREEDQAFGIRCELFRNKNGTPSFVIDAKRIIRRTAEFPIRIRDYVTIKMEYEF